MQLQRPMEKQVTRSFSPKQGSYKWPNEVSERHDKWKFIDSPLSECGKHKQWTMDYIPQHCTIHLFDEDTSDINRLTTSLSWLENLADDIKSTHI